MLSRRRDGGGGYDLIMRAFQDKGVRPNVVLDSQDTRLLHKLLPAGHVRRSHTPRAGSGRRDVGIFPDASAGRARPPTLRPYSSGLEHAYLSRTARRVIQCLHKVNADPGEQPDFEI